MTAVHVTERYQQPSPNMSAVVKDASAVAKDHVIPASRCQGNKMTTTAAVEPVIGCSELANQRSLSDKLDLSVTQSGNI